MKTVCIVPIKQKSSRVKRKNFKKVGKMPLYEITLRKVKIVNSMKFLLTLTVMK